MPPSFVTTSRNRQRPRLVLYCRCAGAGVQRWLRNRAGCVCVCGTGALNTNQLRYTATRAPCALCNVFKTHEKNDTCGWMIPQFTCVGHAVVRRPGAGRLCPRTAAEHSSCQTNRVHSNVTTLLIGGATCHRPVRNAWPPSPTCAARAPMEHSHRPSGGRQSNKPFKSKHATKVRLRVHK